MSARLLRGKPLAEKLREELAARAAAVSEERGSPPHLAILAIGGNPSSQIFLRKKLEACKEAGIECTLESLPESTSFAETHRLLQKLAHDPAVDGIIFDMPVPPQLDPAKLMDALSPDKDVEGVTATNAGRLCAHKSWASLRGSGVMIPCTPNAIVHLLLETQVDPRGLEAVVIGRSHIVGKPVAQLLSSLDATVTLCHAQTRDLAAHVGRADILVCAIGKPGLVRGEWVKPGAVVLDAGAGLEGKRIAGDVEFAAAARRAAFITPVPGGIGPLTVTFLLHNTVLAAERRLAGLKPPKP